MEVQRARIATIAGLCGARVDQDKAYPGWAPNPSSPILQVCPILMLAVLAQGQWSPSVMQGKAELHQEVLAVCHLCIASAGAPKLC